MLRPRRAHSSEEMHAASSEKMFDTRDSSDTRSEGKALVNQLAIWNDGVGICMAFQGLLDVANVLPDASSLPQFAASLPSKESAELAEFQNLSKELESKLLMLTNSIRRMESSKGNAKAASDSSIDTGASDDSEHVSASTASTASTSPTGEKPADTAGRAYPDAQTLDTVMTSCFSVLVDELEQTQRVIGSAGSLAVIDQPMSTQVSYILRDSKRLARRLHMNGKGVAPLGEPEELANDVTVDADEYKPRRAVYTEQALYDPGTLEEQGLRTERTTLTRKRRVPSACAGILNDNDFFVALCNDLLSHGASNPSEIIEKLREARDRKVSLRKTYTRAMNKNRVVDTKKVHKKIVGFTQPARRPNEDYLRMIRGCLFK